MQRKIIHFFTINALAKRLGGLVTYRQYILSFSLEKASYGHEESRRLPLSVKR